MWAGRKQTQNNFPDKNLVAAGKELIPFMTSDTRPKIKDHPIPKLMADAEANFRNLLSRQSKTLEDAVREYKRRYHRDPPRGFDHWWQFAKDNDVLMMDEYDAIVEDLAPFWELPASEVRRRADVVSACRYVLFAIQSLSNFLHMGGGCIWSLLVSTSDELART